MGTNPASLSITDIATLLDRAQRNGADSSAAVSELVEAFRPLARSIARQIGHVDLRDDAEAAAMFELLHTIRRHRSGTHGFPAYVKLCMRGAARRERIRCGPQNVDIAWSRTSMVSGITVETDGSRWGGGETEHAVSTLKPDQQELLWQRYGCDRSVADMAAEHGCTESAISQRLRTAQRAVERVLAA